MRVVTIRPITPKLGIRTRLSIIPKIVVRIVSFRLNPVFPWPFMKFPELRLPIAVYR